MNPDACRAGSGPQPVLPGAYNNPAADSTGRINAASSIRPARRRTLMAYETEPAGPQMTIAVSVLMTSNNQGPCCSTVD